MLDESSGPSVLGHRRLAGSPLRSLLTICVLLLCMSSVRAADAEFGPDFIAGVSAMAFGKVLRASDIASEMAVEMKESALHSSLMDKWNANEAALDEFTAGQRDNVNSAADGVVGALKTDADASIEAVSGTGARGAGRMARLVSTYTHALHQTENIKATQLKDTEQHIQMRLHRTMEKLLNVRDDGINHMRRRGQNTMDRLTLGDYEFAKQTKNDNLNAEWRLEQRALRTEQRLDRMLQETRDLLNRRDSADEKRAADLERKLDEQAREVELQITRDEASAAFLRLARERKAEAILSAQRAASIRQKEQLRHRPAWTNKQLHRSSGALQSHLVSALHEVAETKKLRDQKDKAHVMLQARRQGVFTASGHAGARSIELPAGTKPIKH